MFSIVVALYILTNRTQGFRFFFFFLLSEPPGKPLQGFQFLYILANTCNFLLFKNSHPDAYEVSSCGLDLHFPNN